MELIPAAGLECNPSLFARMVRKAVHVTVRSCSQLHDLALEILRLLALSTCSSFICHLKSSSMGSSVAVDFRIRKHR